MDARAAESHLAFAERAGPGLSGPDRKAVFEQLEERYDELLAALQWFLDQRRTEEAIGLARSLAPFWNATRRLEEGSRWFGRVLGSAGAENANRGRACVEAGLLEFWQGADDRASALHGRALELGRRIGDPTVEALALTGLARIALRSDDIGEARRLCREALAVSEGSDDPLGRSSAVHVLGVTAQIAGDLLEAREWMTVRIELARELGSYAGIGMEANNLSMVERQLGNFERADELAREALEIFSRREDEWANSVRAQRARGDCHPASRARACGYPCRSRRGADGGSRLSLAARRATALRANGSHPHRRDGFGGVRKGARGRALAGAP